MGGHVVVVIMCVHWNVRQISLRKGVGPAEGVRTTQLLVSIQHVEGHRYCTLHSVQLWLLHSHTEVALAS